MSFARPWLLLILLLPLCWWWWRRTRIAGGTRDSNFIARFGLAAAAAALYADQSPVVHGLVNLHQSEPKAKPPIVERVTRWFGQPVRAAAIIALCLVTLLALPL
ncbi:MAG: hypothetical protein SGJ01_10425, partial [Gemmatimonadota bacterium]|nr:hypothetical protein [Gemmatimonadota bacterium]